LRLFIDDDHLVRAVPVECLRDAGFEVIDFSATGSIEGAR
jgi:hypothetical protein